MKGARFSFGLFAVWTLLSGCSPREPAPTSGPLLYGYWRAVAQELRPGMSDADKAIVIARWVAANNTNQPTERHGPHLCGHRSTIFELLAKRADLQVSRLAIGNFAGSGHTAVEVWYDGAWHFLDVTYAGYFERDGRILSFQEIQASPEQAIAGMVVFDGTRDLWPDGRPVDNRERMALNYTAENIRSAVVLEPTPAPAPSGSGGG